MSNLLHCDIGEVVQYLKEQNKVFLAIRLSDCLSDYNESLVKLTIENQKLRDERDEARQRFCTMSVQLGQFYRRVGGKTVQVTTPEDVANIMGWDCFKENTNG